MSCLIPVSFIVISLIRVIIMKLEDVMDEWALVDTYLPSTPPLSLILRAVKWAGLFCVMVSLDLVVDSPIQPKALHPIRSIPIDVDAMAAET